MPDKINKKFEARHLAGIRKIQKKVRSKYLKTIGKIYQGLPLLNLKSGTFMISDYPALNNKITSILIDFTEEVNVTLLNGIKEQWELSTEKNAEVIHKSYAGKKLAADVERMIYDPQSAALDQFTKRKIAGLDLSDRVLKYTSQLQGQIEQNLYAGISEGRSAAAMARDQVKYMENPEPLFRRVRDTEGKLQLSSAAKKYYDELGAPGQGVYRSPYKNFMRITRTTINDSYREADMVRYRSLPFIIGYQVNLSNNHPRTDLCFTNPYYKIITSKGDKCIKDIQKGDFVLSHKGKFRRVLRTFRSSETAIEMTKISGKIMYDHRGKEYSLNATNNHPVLIGSEWVPICEVKVGDKVRILANPCKTCGKLIPHRRNYCSKSCASFKTATNQHKDPKHTERLRDKRKTLLEENGGKLPWMADYLASGRNIINLENTPERKEAARKRSLKMASEGSHPFQRADNLIRANKALAVGKFSSFIERKMGWLLDEKGIRHTKCYPFIRDVKFKNGNSRMYFIDFVLDDHKIAIEVDGEYWHQDKAADAERQKEIEEKGFMVLRFSGDQIRNRLDECSQEIDRVLMNHNDEYEFTDFVIEKVESTIQRRGGNKIVKYNFEVDVDNSYICNGFVVHNCDDLKGTYPKTFTWRRWHPQCMCNCTAKLASPEDYDKYEQALLNGTADKFQFKDVVNDTPPNFKTYVEKKQGSMDNWKRKPDWVTENGITL